MRFVVLVLATAYAVVNVFGAWGSVRRKGWIATVFMVAGGLLMTAGVAYAYRAAPEGFVLLAAGALLASVASLLNARLVIGRVVPLYHLIRALAGGALVALGWWVMVG